MASYPTLSDDALPQAVRSEFENQNAQFDGWASVEHKPDGRHGAIHVDSLAADGAVTGESSATFDGNVTADADGDPIVIGSIGTTAGEGSTGPGVSINRGGAAATGSFDLVLSPVSGGHYTLHLVDRSGATPHVPFRAQFDAAAGQYHVSPNGITQVTYPCTLGDLFQASNTGRWAALYAKALDATQTLVLSGESVPAQITATQNNYTPAGWGTCRTLVINADAARDITGFQAGQDGEEKLVINTGNFTITLKYASGSSSAANQIIAPSGVDYALVANGTAFLKYRGSRWWVK